MTVLRKSSCDVPQQLGKDAAFVPPLRKDYDVERRGHYGAGKFSYPTTAPKHPKKQDKSVAIEDLKSSNSWAR